MRTLISWRVVPVLLAALLLVSCQKKLPYEGKSVAELEAMLRDPSPTVRVQGAHGLAKLKAEAEPAVPALAEALEAPEQLVRQHAARALGEVGPVARDAVPALTKTLSDPEWAVRRQAALALGGIGPDAAAAVPDLQALERNDSHQVVRTTAAEALRKIQP
jgi:HEAT repeat protein